MLQESVNLTAVYWLVVLSSADEDSATQLHLLVQWSHRAHHQLAHRHVQRNLRKNGACVPAMLGSPRTCHIELHSQPRTSRSLQHSPQSHSLRDVKRFGALRAP
eukprot:SAG11_NODE_17854_length_507_cov_0.950980_2_plen_103_part_01